MYFCDGRFATAASHSCFQTPEERTALAAVSLNRAQVARSHARECGQEHPSFGDGSLRKACQSVAGQAVLSPIENMVPTLSSDAGQATSVYEATVAQLMETVSSASALERTAAGRCLYFHDHRWPPVWDERTRVRALIGRFFFLETP